MAHNLYCAGILDYKGLTSLQPQNSSWLMNRCNILGAALTLAGVVCFFAFNWDQMGKVLKLGLPLIAFIITGFWGAFTGLEKQSSQILAFCSAFLIGVCFAVFGQVYQTGADAWQLFFTWALCILPFAFIVSTAALWMLFVIVSNIFLFLYSADFMSGKPTLLLLTSYNILFTVFAFAAERANSFLNRKWFLYTVFIAAAAYAFCGAASDIFGKGLSSPFILFWFFEIAAFTYLFNIKKHITLIGFLALAAIGVLLFAFGRYSDIYDPLFWAVITLGAYTAAGFGVMRINKYFNAGDK